jgi:hypothetical protein
MEDPAYEQYWRMWEKYEDCLTMLIGAELNDPEVNHDSFLSHYRSHSNKTPNLEVLCTVICHARSENVQN